MQEDILSLEQALYAEPDFDFVDESEPENEKYYDFQWELYDWDKFDPKKFGYQVIRLMGDPENKRKKSAHSGKYFALVTRSSHPYLMRLREWWYPLVEYRRDEHDEKTDTIKRITAHYNEGPRRSRKVVYMHRVVAEAEGLEVGDHINGYSLDNRNCNLRPVSTLHNRYNVQRVRTVFPELLPGVQWTDGRHVRIYGMIKVGDKKLSSGSEGLTWLPEQQEEAWRWCAKKKLELFGLKKLANGPNSVPLPEFPPRLRRLFPVRTIDPGMEIPGF